MTKINSIVMSGFKSFATKTELVFGDKYNCVLGPNGSGKSNIIDALCFVLGKGSSRELRAEKAANLIYNGGKAHTPAKEGMVAIYFDNSKKEFPTDDNEVKISRIVKESGQSTYKINDKVRTRQEILELLSMAKIDPDGYNIILQGDVTHFIDMSTDERRRIIEDIAGIGIYEEKKEKAMNELTRVEQRMNEAEIILVERKTYLGNLKDERDQASKYRAIEKKLLNSKGSLAKHQIKKKEQDLEKLSKGTLESRRRSEEIQKEIISNKDEISLRRQEISEINHEIEEKGEKSQVALHKEIEFMKVEMGTNKNKIESFNAESKKIAERRIEMARNLEDVEKRLLDSNNEKSDALKRKESITKELNNILKKIEEFRKKNKMDDLGNIDKEIETIDKDSDERQKEIQALREQQQENLRQKDRLELQIKAVDDQIAKVEEVKREYRKEIDALRDMKNQFKNITLELNKKLHEDSNLAAQLGNAKSRIYKIEQELATLMAKQAAQQATAAAGTAVQKILENRQRFPGVYGTVADLGSVKGKYAVALEIAAGPRLKSIVVNDDSTAAKCISFLKENRFGFAPFIPLNKIRDIEYKEDTKKFLKSPGVHGLAINLIEYDPKFEKAFRYVFGSTLIVETVEHARKIGVGVVRMVTLDGDLLESSGAMIGGWREKSKLAFKDKENDRKLEETEEMVEEERKLISLLEEKRAKLDETITNMRQEKANLEGEIIKLEKSLHLEGSDLDASMKVKSEFVKELKQVDKRLDDMQENISTVNSNLAQLRIKKQQLRDKIAQLKNPTLLAELSAFDQKKEELKIELGRLEVDASSIDKQLETIYIPEKDRIQKILKQHEKEEVDFKNQIKEINESMKKRQVELNVAEKKEKEFYDRFKALFAKRDKLNKEMQTIEVKIIKLEEEARRLEAKVNDTNIDNARISAEIAGLVEEIRQYGEFDELKKNIEDLRQDVYNAEKDLREFGNVNMKALEIYEHVEKEYGELMLKKDTLRLEKDQVMAMMQEIEGKKKELFMKTFDCINENFARIFQELIRKGEAFIELENPETVFDAGVVLKVKIVGKKFLDIRSLSGGEKTMTALAFISAIQEYEPSSFYVIDEVDAALDKRNAELLAKRIRKYSEKAQYIMISHNDGVISEADTLYGVSMNEHGMSKVVSLKI